MAVWAELEALLEEVCSCVLYLDTWQYTELEALLEEVCSRVLYLDTWQYELEASLKKFAPVSYI